MSRVKVLVLPLSGRQWLFHAWQDPAAEAAKKQLRWRDGHSLEERLSILGTNTGTWLETKLRQQWAGLEAARQGSIRNRLYRLAQWVLSKEDPQESFLKSVPGDTVSVDILYPSSWDERLVRRRMRAMLHREGFLYGRRKWLWSLACLPLIPLLATPLPNIPLYYSGYKVYSSSRAGAGCAALQEMWGQHDVVELRKLREQLLELQSWGVVFPQASWPRRLVQAEPRYKAILDNTEGRMRHLYRGEPPEHRIPRMVPNRQLDHLLEPTFRSGALIQDDIIMRIGSEFQASALLEHATRARRLLKLQQQRQDAQPPDQLKSHAPRHGSAGVATAAAGAG